MKLPRLLSSLLFAAVSAASLQAGALPPASVDFMVLEKASQFNQTGPTLGDVTPDASVPYFFGVFVSGESLSGILPTPPNAVVALPPGATLSAPLNLTPPGMFDDEWNMELPFATQSAMDAAVGTGAYNLTIGGQTFTLTLSGNLYPNTPLVTATANGDTTWLPDGRLLYYAGNNNPLTLASNTYTSTGSIHIGMEVNTIQGQPYHNDFNHEYFGSGPASLSQTFLTPSEFVVGTTYEVTFEFNAIITGLLPLAGLYMGDPVYASAQAVAIYTSRTTFQMLVIPEPSSYAALFGAGALALAAWHRRRRAA
jgi:hypothetical protein